MLKRLYLAEEARGLGPLEVLFRGHGPQPELPRECEGFEGFHAV